MSDLDALVGKFWAAKQVADEVARELDAAKVELIAAMDDAGLDKLTAEVDGHYVGATKVVGTRIVIDETKLKKTIGAPKWKKVTKEVLDKELLEAHVTTGDIDANEVAMCSEEHENKPYVRVNDKGAIPGHVQRKRKPSKAAAKVRK